MYSRFSNEEPLKRKIDIYIKSLETIMNSEQESKRRDKAKSLHDNYKKESKKLFLLKISWEWWRGENLLDGSSFKTVS